MVFPHAKDLHLNIEPSGARHPSQLYEAALEGPLPVPGAAAPDAFTSVR